MLGVMIIPTGIGCEIGGHAGDANAAAQLMGEVCDRLIVHPNVVNASDINEMPPNALYVEGSTLDRFLDGKVNLRPVRNNRVLVICNEATPNVINSVSAARACLGLEVEIRTLPQDLIMEGWIGEDGIATGRIFGIDMVVDTASLHEFDALAIHSPIEVDRQVIENYLTQGGINPWGGVEAILSRELSERLGKQVAHAPVEPDWGHELVRNVDPRQAAEMLSSGHLFSVLKGLHRAPRPVNPANSNYRFGDICAVDIDFMVSPMCWGRPHDSCDSQNIPMIFVENNTCISDDVWSNGPRTEIHVANYLEAAGLVAAMKIGVSRESVLRPISETKVNGEHK